jgi:hypothetical protein
MTKKELNTVQTVTRLIAPLLKANGFTLIEKARLPQLQGFCFTNGKAEVEIHPYGYLVNDIVGTDPRSVMPEHTHFQGHIISCVFGYLLMNELLIFPYKSL